MSGPKVCICGQKIIFAKETKADGTESIHPLDVSSPVYKVSCDGAGNFTAEKDNRELPVTAVDAVAHLVSHFRSCGDPNRFRKEYKRMAEES